ncbi:MAG: hypothetical protein GX606_04645, partial [Elusimicrobia bacterium]|nr:hypothetical protein [Elusimicrobiota bacterium]
MFDKDREQFDDLKTPSPIYNREEGSSLSAPQSPSKSIPAVPADSVDIDLGQNSLVFAQELQAVAPGLSAHLPEKTPALSEAQPGGEVLSAAPVVSGPFQSRFKSWMRAVAFAIVCIFIPDQVSWAFNYNPAVIWGPQMGVVTPDMTPAQAAAVQVSGGIEHLLGQVVKNGSNGIELALDDPEPPRFFALKKAEPRHVLKVAGKDPLTDAQARGMAEWLRTKELNILNCGVYALTDILAAHGILRTPQEASVLTLAVDTIAGIIKPGDATLKTSLYSIRETARAFGLNYEAARLAPEDVLTLKTPFIAHLKDEHFVTVTAVNDGTVFFNDLGVATMLPQAEFTARLTGFVLAQDLEYFFKADHQVLDPATQAFVWGDKWKDRSGDLPGLYSSGDIATQVAIQVAMSLVTFGLASWLAPASMIVQMTMSMYVAFAMAASMLSSALSQAYYLHCMDNGGSAESCGKTAMHISRGVNAGLNAAAGGLSAGGSAGSFVSAFATSYAMSVVQYEVYKYVIKYVADDPDDPTVLEQAIAGAVSSFAVAAASWGVGALADQVGDSSSEGTGPVDSDAKPGAEGPDQGADPKATGPAKAPDSTAPKGPTTFMEGLKYGLGAGKNTTFMQVVIQQAASSIVSITAAATLEALGKDDPNDTTVRAVMAGAQAIGSAIGDAAAKGYGDGEGSFGDRLASVDWSKAIGQSLVAGAAMGLTTYGFDALKESAIGKDDGSRSYRQKELGYNALAMVVSQAVSAGAVVMTTYTTPEVRAEVNSGNEARVDAAKQDAVKENYANASAEQGTIGSAFLNQWGNLFKDNMSTVTGVNYLAKNDFVGYGQHMADFQGWSLQGVQNMGASYRKAMKDAKEESSTGSKVSGPTGLPVGYASSGSGDAVQTAHDNFAVRISNTLYNSSLSAYSSAFQQAAVSNLSQHLPATITTNLFGIQAAINIFGQANFLVMDKTRTNQKVGFAVNTESAEQIQSLPSFLYAFDEWKIKGEIESAKDIKDPEARNKAVAKA